MRPVTMTSAALAIALAALPAHARQSSSLDGLDLVGVLPDCDDMPAFRTTPPAAQQASGEVRPHHRGASVGRYRVALCTLEREDDGCILRVSVAATDTSAAADELSRRAIETPTGDFPKGNPSGNRVAPHAWHTLRPGAATARGTYSLVLRDGRAMAVVQLMHRVRPGSAGRPALAEIARDDLLLAERLAVGCLERLRKLGYGDDQWRKAQSRTRGGKKPKGK